MKLLPSERAFLQQVIEKLEDTPTNTPIQNEIQQSVAYKLKTLLVDDYEWYEGIADKLAKATSRRVNGLAIYNWCGPDGVGSEEEYKQVDALVKRYLGGELYKAGEDTARLSNVLEATLNGKDSTTIGGITFKNLQKRKNPYSFQKEEDASRNF